MKNKELIFWITRAAVSIALLVVLQAVTAPLGNTFVTGSLVNMLLVVSVITCGFPTGISVAVVSPVLARLFGIGPSWIIVPFIMLGNAVFVELWHFTGKLNVQNSLFRSIISALIASVAKFLILYIGVVRVAVPLLLDLPEKQAQVISGLFSTAQLITALIGSALAILIIPVINKAVKSRSS